MRHFSRAILFAALTLGAATIFVAAPHAQTTDQTAHSAAGDAGPATPEYAAAMDAMMSGMMIPYTGDADIDFVRGMIPHHQGAVNNARIVLKHGKDPEVRKFAEDVIAAQEAEIKWMTDWLAKHDN